MHICHISNQTKANHNETNGPTNKQPPNSPGTKKQTKTNQPNKNKTKKLKAFVCFCDMLGRKQMLINLPADFPSERE